MGTECSTRIEFKKIRKAKMFLVTQGPLATLLTDGALAEIETEREIYLHINV